MLGRSVTFLFTGLWNTSSLGGGSNAVGNVPKHPDSNTSSLGGGSKQPNNVMLFWPVTFLCYEICVVVTQQTSGNPHKRCNVEELRFLSRMGMSCHRSLRQGRSC